jgi:Flp pilus assembly pilin Flp
MHQMSMRTQLLADRPACGTQLVRRFFADEHGFAAAESALLALLLIGICIAVGTIVQQAAINAATTLNEELAGAD